MAEVVQSLKSRQIWAPIYAAAADIFGGALLMPGVTAETDDGVLINCTESSNADCIGILTELLDYSVTGESLVNGTTWFNPKSTNPAAPAHWVELVDTATLVKVAYDTVDTLGVTSASGTTITITSLEDNIDSAFLYVQAGTGIGQIEFVSTSASGSCVVATAFATQVDSTSTVLKILPLYHRLLKWDIAVAADTLKIGSDAAVGSGRALILERHIVRNGLDELLDPDGHGGLTGLNSLAQFQIYCLAHIQDTGFHPVD